MWHMDNGWWIGGITMTVFTVFLLVLIWALVSIIRQPETPPSQTPPPSARKSSVEILEERYARGELSDEEFDRMLQRLQQARQDDS